MAKVSFTISVGKTEDSLDHLFTYSTPKKSETLSPAELHTSDHTLSLSHTDGSLSTAK